jgi:lysophospholipase-3
LLFIFFLVTNLVPELWDCFAARISRVFNGSGWSDKPGVWSRPGAGLDAINYLDPANPIVRHESMYFAATSAALINAGWAINVSLGGLPYDWRQHPEEQPELFEAFQQQVEDLSAAMGGKPVVLVSHSMGGPFTHYFLNKVVSQSWKDKFVAKWIAVCSPFGGAAVAVRAMLSGYNFGIPILTNSEGLQIGPNMGSTFFLLPRNDSNWPNLVDTLSGDSYGPSELYKAFSISGMNASSAKIANGALAWTSADPGVRVDLVAGSKLKTEVGYEYDSTTFSSGPVQTYYDSGDATVPLKSALLPATEYGWQNVATTQIFPNVDHVGMLADAGFISWLLEALQAE